VVRFYRNGTENTENPHARDTKYPADEWTAQQLREAAPWGRGPKSLIRDRDGKYGTHFSAVAVGSGIKEIKTPYRMPQANGVCKQFMSSVCAENVWIMFLSITTNTCSKS
jgi:putative transposase